MTANKIHRLKNPIQEYAWGSSTAIQSLMGKPANGKPMAELWMGTHPKAPSQVLINGGLQSLDKTIEDAPELILGKNSAEKFAGKLPFLFKILAAGRPLSVQVHPNFEQAKEGFARENKQKIPLDAPNRNYKDANHKPEILCALTPFQGLKGFRIIEEIRSLMDRLSLSTLTDELELLRKPPHSSALKTFFSSLMSMDKTRQNKVAGEAAKSAKNLAGENQAFKWIAELNKEYPGDIGILSPVILNLVMLAPGEAIYLPAGELHAYLDGLGIELMANSDNVLRGGLTPKHIDVPELLRIVNFKTGPVRKVTSTSRNTCRTDYETPAEEFLLSTISVDKNNGFSSTENRRVEILICIKGKAEIVIQDNDEVMPAKQGQSFIIPSKTTSYSINGNATFYMASVPSTLPSPPTASPGIKTKALRSGGL